MKKIGFMQGRLSPKPSDRIQAFPKDSWRQEFALGKELGFQCTELIFDTLYLEQNPLISDSGRRELVQLSQESGVEITSLCADYFMVHLLPQKYDVAMELLGIAQSIHCPLVEFPCMGPTSLKSPEIKAAMTESLLKLNAEAEKIGIQLALETDLPPPEFKEFLSRFSKNVGANLDLGNSAIFGFDPMAEARAFGSRVFNVHIKDGVVGASTVPLTTGHTDFKRAFEALKLAQYQGDFILQTAPDIDFLGVASKYRKMTADWIKDL